MSKTMCEKGRKGEQDTPEPKYVCKKCGALVKNGETGMQTEIR